MKDFSSAEKLAETMVEIGENINKKVIAIITDMNEPLGKHIGNSLGHDGEVGECGRIYSTSGAGAEDCRNLGYYA